MTKLSPGDKYSDETLERLLDLDGLIMEMGAGFWVKIEAQKVTPQPGNPQGVRYSLCLFSPDGQRLVGFDNAHAIKTGSGPSKKTSPTKDHVHKAGRIKPYAYSNAEALLVDFWEAVDETLKANGVT